MEIINNNKLKSVKTKYPDIISEEGCEKFKNLFYEIRDIESKLADIVEEQIRLESLLEKKTDEYNNLLQLFDIEYETYNHEYKINKSYIGFNMSAEINKNLK